jgi:hypothetical protein
MSTTRALPWDREAPAQSLSIDRIEAAVRDAAPQWGHAISPPPRHWAFAPAGPERRHFAIMAGALLAALALGWIAGSSLHGFFSPDPTSASRQQDINAPARADESDNVTTGGTAKTSREAIRARADAWSLAPASERIAGPEPTARPARQVVPSAIPSATAARQNPAPAPDTQANLQPFPETRPTTVPGWVVRDVAGSHVVLEGPGGVLKTTTGETVPGLGKVDFIVRWGSRWIVGTSKGLITTP